jgi:hypothetical protein
VIGIPCETEDVERVLINGLKQQKSKIMQDAGKYVRNASERVVKSRMKIDTSKYPHIWNTSDSN